MNLQVNGKAPEPYEKIEPYKKSPMMLINEISRIMGDKIREKGEDNPISQKSGRALLIELSKRDGRTQLDLVKATHLKAPTISVVLQKLEHDGYVRRTPDQYGLRATRVYLTEKGRELDNKMKARIRAEEEEAMSNLTPSEYDTLLKLLEKLKSNMLRSISHDFRTPLTGIMGAAGLLKEADELDAGVRKELAGEIQEQSVWLMRLMENILNMTKLESEEFEIRKNQEVVDDLIYEAVSHIIGLREKRRFEIKLPSELIVVNVDGKLMVQVLVNLLDNAMKHTGENGWICIEARYDAGKVWISVEDDGDGIQEDLKENIFDEFVTRSDEKGDRQRGIGLGLAICKAVVNAHGGNICAENRKEGGARFMFWLEARQVSTDGR